MPALHLLSHGYASAVLFAGTVVMFAVVLVVRDGVSFPTVCSVGAVFVGALWWTPMWLHLGMASLVMWLLLIGEIPGVWDGPGSSGHDADQSSGDRDVRALRSTTPFHDPC